MSDTDDQHSSRSSGAGSKHRKQEFSKYNLYKDSSPTNELWTDGLLCAFELVRSNRRPSAHKTNTLIPRTQQRDNGNDASEPKNTNPRGVPDGSWVPIGWSRISELTRRVQTDARWASQQIDSTTDEEDDYTVADVAAPYWERPSGPTWWCHVIAGHRTVDAWLSNADWLHPAIRMALRDEGRLISERMKHLLYEVILYWFLFFMYLNLYILFMKG